MSTDYVVTEHVDDLIKRIKTVSLIRDKIVYVYDQESLLHSTKKLGYPAVGVIYVGMKGNSDSSRTGLAAELTCDIYLLGADACITQLSKTDEKPTVTKILDLIRVAIRCHIAPSQRKWKFIFEIPFALDGGSLAYVQRWSTVTLLTS